MGVTAFRFTIIPTVVDSLFKLITNETSKIHIADPLWRDPPHQFEVYLFVCKNVILQVGIGISCFTNRGCAIQIYKQNYSTFTSLWSEYLNCDLICRISPYHNNYNKIQCTSKMWRNPLQIAIPGGSDKHVVVVVSLFPTEIHDNKWYIYA